MIKLNKKIVCNRETTGICWLLDRTTTESIFIARTVRKSFAECTAWAQYMCVIWWVVQIFGWHPSLSKSFQVFHCDFVPFGVWFWCNNFSAHGKSYPHPPNSHWEHSHRVSCYRSVVLLRIHTATAFSRITSNSLPKLFASQTHTQSLIGSLSRSLRSIKQQSQLLSCIWMERLTLYIMCPCRDAAAADDALVYSRVRTITSSTPSIILSCILCSVRMSSVFFVHEKKKTLFSSFFWCLV